MNFLNNQPARLCACCGQSLPSESRAAIALDETVLRLCNRAFEIASRRSSATVEIAHLICSFVGSPVASVAFDTFEIEVGEITDFAYAWLSKTSVAGQGLEPQISPELTELLSRAEQLARSKGRAAAAIGDIIETLVFHTQDLATADFAGEALRSSRMVRQQEREVGRKVVQHVAQYTGQQLSQNASQQSLHFATEQRAEDWSQGRTQHHSQHPRAEQSGTSGYSSHREADMAACSAHQASNAIKPRSSSRLLTATYSFSQPIAHSEANADRAAAIDRDESFADEWDDDDRTSAAGGQRGYGSRAGIKSRSSSGSSSSRTSSSSSSSSSSSQRSNRTRQHFFRRRSLRSLEVFRNAMSRDDDSRNRQRQSTRSERASERSHLRGALMSRPEARDFETDDGDARRGGWNRAQDRDRNLDRDTYRDRNRRRDRDRESDSDRDDASSASGERQKRFYLAMDDDVVRAPSIGPKTATKLNALGIQTVRDLLEVDAHDLADRARARFLTPQKILDWQAQARLVCTVPWLRGTHAQLLVGAGFNSVETILAADSASLCSQILSFATTRDGQSILRAGPPPDIERIAQWVGFAEQAEPERVAA